MSVFKNVNFDLAGLDSLFSYFRNSNCIYKPLLTNKEKTIAHSQNISSKAHLLFKKIIDWQNELAKRRIDPGSQVIYSHGEYTAFVASQKALNKLKRKFNKLFLENLTPSQKEEMAKKQLRKMHEPVNPSTIEYMQYQIENFGYNDVCLKVFANHFVGYHLLFSYL